MDNSLNSKVNRNYWYLGLAILLALFAVGWTLYWPRLGYDDAYITYRYAHNIAHGQGFVFNPGEKILGTTTPLYTLILAGLSFIFSDLPRLSIWLGGINWGLAVLALFLVGRTSHPTIGVLAAALLAFDPLTNNSISMETSLYLALSLWALYCQMTARPKLAAGFASLAFLTRWDGILIIGALGLAEWVRTKKFPITMMMVWLVTAGPWLIFSQWYFGSVFPNSFFAKAGQAGTGLLGGEAASFGDTWLANWLSRVNQNALMWVYLPLGGLGGWSAIRQLPMWWPHWLYTLLYAIGYLFLGVVGFHWYYPPLTPGLSLLVALGVFYIYSRFSASRWALAIYAVISFLVSGLQLEALWQNRFEPNARVISYQQVSGWLNQNALPTSTVATIEIGIIGYETHLPLVDVMGLVTPTMIGHLQDWAQIHKFAISRHWPDYLVALPVANSLLETAWFKQTYTLATRIETINDPVREILIYQRRDDFPPVSYMHSWPLEATFNQELALLGVQAQLLNEHKEIAIQLNWHTLKNTGSNYQFTFELLDLHTGQKWPLLENSQPFYGSGPTSTWRQSQSYPERYLFQWPAEASLTSPHRLLVRLYQMGSEVNPTCVTVTPCLAASGLLETVPTHQPSANFISQEAQFADGLRLLGYRWTSPSQIELFWESQKVIPATYTAFVHILNSDKTLTAQHDSIPALGQLPTYLWLPKILVNDAHSFDERQMPMQGEFCIGLYDSITQIRLPVEDAQSFSTHDNLVCASLP